MKYTENEEKNAIVIQDSSLTQSFHKLCKTNENHLKIKPNIWKVFEGEFIFYFLIDIPPLIFQKYTFKRVFLTILNQVLHAGKDMCWLASCPKYPMC